MAFEVHDYIDFVQLLTDHPEWRADLRRLLLTDELLALPEIVRELAEAQRRTEARVEELAEAQRQLAEAQRRTEARVEELAEAQRQLAEAQRQLAEAQRRTEERLGRVEEQMAAMAEAQRQMAQSIEALTKDQRRMNDTLSDLKGTVLEWRYRDKAHAYFGDLLRRVRVVPVHTLEETLEARLSPNDMKEVRRLDLLVRGRPYAPPDAPEVYLAVEISATVDRHDVERAARRAAALHRAGYRAIPAVVGEHLSQGAEDGAKTDHVMMMTDGRVQLWDQAFQAWSGSRYGESFEEAP